MIRLILLPIATAVSVSAISAATHTWLPPRVAARFVASSLVLVVMTIVPTAVVLALGFLAHLPVIGVGFTWCTQLIGLHGSIPIHVGLPALILVTAGALRSWRVVGCHRALRFDNAPSIHVATSITPFAVTLPGRGGQIVISSALVQMLDDDEQRVVITHERAHAEHRHDRYLLIAALATALVPPLRLVGRSLGYSIERWADEAAASECGDRHLVARTLAKVALHDHPPTIAAFSGLGVAARMSALIAPPVAPPRHAYVAAIWSVVPVTAALSVHQLMHVESLVAILCPH